MLQLLLLAAGGGLSKDMGGLLQQNGSDFLLFQTGIYCYAELGRTPCTSQFCYIFSILCRSEGSTECPCVARQHETVQACACHPQSERAQ